MCERVLFNYVAIIASKELTRSGTKLNAFLTFLFSSCAWKCKNTNSYNSPTRHLFT